MRNVLNEAPTRRRDRRSPHDPPRHHPGRLPAADTPQRHGLTAGQLGDERFDREVVPYCSPRYIGQERFYDREDHDRWIEGLPVDQLGTTREPPAERLRADPYTIEAAREKGA